MYEACSATCERTMVHRAPHVLASWIDPGCITDEEDW